MEIKGKRNKRSSGDEKKKRKRVNKNKVKNEIGREEISKVSR